MAGESPNRRSLPEGIGQGRTVLPRRCTLPRGMKRRAFLRGIGGAAGGLAFAPALAAAAPAGRHQVLDPPPDAGIEIRSRADVVSSKSAVSSEVLEVALANARAGGPARRSGALALSAV